MSAITPNLDALLELLGDSEPACSRCERPIDVDLTDTYAARVWVWVSLDGTVRSVKLKPALCCRLCLEDDLRRTGKRASR